MRHPLVAVVILALAAGVGCGTKVAPPPPPAAPAGTPAAPAAGAPPSPAADFTLTAEDLGKAFEADPAAARAKYAGKRVELSGAVTSLRLGVPGYEDFSVAALPQSKTAGVQTLTVMPAKAEQAKYDGMKALARGQAVTVRGAVAGQGLVLTECEFVRVGPSPALPVTAAGLLKALKSDEEQKKYVGKDVLVRGVVRKATWNGTVVTLMLADPGAAGGEDLEATLNPANDIQGIELAKTKVGAEVIVLGEAQTANNGRIWDFRLLAAVPEGVTLPAGKK